MTDRKCRQCDTPHPRGMSPYCERCQILRKTVERKCPQCNEIKDISYFRKAETAKTIQCYCRDCRTLDSKECKSCNITKPMSDYVTVNSPTCQQCITERATIGKVCNICKLRKNPSAFYKSKHAVDGLQFHCKECANMMSPIWDAQRNIKQRNLRLAADSRAKTLASPRKPHTTSNPLDVIMTVKMSTMVTNNNKRCKQRGMAGVVSMTDWRFILALADDCCVACGEEFDWVNPRNALSPSMDHIISIKNGGNHFAINVQPMHLECNIKKGRTTIDYRVDGFIEAIEQNCAERGMALQ